MGEKARGRMGDGGDKEREMEREGEKGRRGEGVRDLEMERWRDGENGRKREGEKRRRGDL